MKIHRCRTLPLISLLALQMSTAFAQGNEEEELALIYGDKATVSIATGAQQPLRRAPSVATVITAEDIAAMGATDLDQVLETVPGMHVARAANVYMPLYTIRGMYSNPSNNQVLMLQNGIPVTDPYNGDRGVYWSGLPLENIARIEIIRGPGSALYGADAFAGVINLITKTAADTPGTQFGLRGGSADTWNKWDSWDTWFQHGGQLGPLEVATYLRLGTSDGNRQTISADAQSGRDKAFGTHASLAPGPVQNGYDAIDGSVDLSYGPVRLRAGYKLRDHLGVGAGIGSALDPVAQVRSERITSDLSFNTHFAQDWNVGATLAYMKYEENINGNAYYQISPPGSRFPTGTFTDGMIGDPERYQRQYRLSAFAAYTGFTKQSWRVGVGHDDLDLYKTETHKNYLLNANGVPAPTAFQDYNGIQPHIPPVRRKLTYAYVQDQVNFLNDWTFTGGVRYDNYSDFGVTTNPRAALVWDASLDLTAKLLYGRAFRAPSFNEQQGINPVNNGNPDLKPETVQTFELAFAWQARQNTQLNLSIYRFDTKHLIRADANTAPAPGGTYRNVGAQHGQGMELEVVWDPSRNWRLTGNYAYQRTIDEATNTDAGYAPHHHLYARTDWRFISSLMASAQINWVAERKRAAGDKRPDIADYTTMDLTLRTTRGKDKWDFTASVRNLFDATVLEPTLAPGTAIPNDLPMARRTAYLQAVYQM